MTQQSNNKSQKPNQRSGAGVQGAGGREGDRKKPAPGTSHKDAHTSAQRVSGRPERTGTNGSAQGAVHRTAKASANPMAHKAADGRKSSQQQQRSASGNGSQPRNSGPQVRSNNPGRRHGAPASPATAEEVRVGDRIIVTIKRIGINGEGVGYYKRKAVFINGALPEEVVKATVTKVEQGYLNASVTEIEKRSAARQQPECPVYDECGGCQLQHMNYDAQLRSKEELVRESFQRYAGMQQLPMRPIIGMEDPWGYRNKAQLQTGLEDGEVLTGLYAAGSHRLVDISGCAVQHPTVNRVIDRVKSILSEMQIPIYNEKTRDGAIKTIVARVGRAEGSVQLTLVTVTDRLPDTKRLVQRIREELPVVTTIAHNINKDKTPLIFGEKTVILWGKERLDETLGSVRFSLSPRAFFQLNPVQTVKLYDAVKEAAQLAGSELVVDAYCGTGTIGLWLAPSAKEVRGIELIPEAVKDARDNAQASGVDNARFFEGRAEQLLPEWVGQGIRPDVVVVDPPRTGCERQLLQALTQARPKRIVYVSCNPATLAKDCQALFEGGYRLEWVQPVDMFPHTSHVESCSLLVLDGN